MKQIVNTEISSPYKVNMKELAYLNSLTSSRHTATLAFIQSRVSSHLTNVSPIFTLLVGQVWSPLSLEISGSLAAKCSAVYGH